MPQPQSTPRASFSGAKVVETKQSSIAQMAESLEAKEKAKPAMRALRALRARQILRFLSGNTNTLAEHRQTARGALQDIDRDFVKTKRLAASAKTSGDGDEEEDEEEAWLASWDRGQGILGGYIKQHFKKWIEDEGLMEANGVDDVVIEEAEEQVEEPDEQGDAKHASISNEQHVSSGNAPPPIDPAAFEYYQDYVEAVRRAGQSAGGQQRDDIPDSFAPPMGEIDREWYQWFRQVHRRKRELAKEAEAQVRGDGDREVEDVEGLLAGVQL